MKLCTLLKLALILPLYMYIKMPLDLAPIILSALHPKTKEVFSLATQNWKKCCWFRKGAENLAKLKYLKQRETLLTFENGARGETKTLDLNLYAWSLSSVSFGSQKSRFKSVKKVGKLSYLVERMAV